MDKFSYLGNADVAQIEALYQAFLKDPDSVDPSWKDFFQGFQFAQTNFEPVATPSLGRAGEGAPSLGRTGEGSGISPEFNVINLINGYRNRGHLFTRTNPVRERRKYFPSLDLENFGLSEADLETVFHAGSLIGIGDAKLKDILEHQRATYCRSVGAEYKYIRTPE